MQRETGVAWYQDDEATKIGSFGIGFSLWRR